MHLLKKKDFKIRFKSGFTTIGKYGLAILRGNRINDMYSIGSIINKISFSNDVYLFDSHDNTFLWHLWLGHINKNKMWIMSNKRMLAEVNIDDFNISESCVKEKLSRKSFSKHWKSSNLLDIIHLDLCGPMRIKTYKDIEYFITFIDDYSWFRHIYLLKHKSETLKKFKIYKKEVETQLGRSIKILNNDRGGEYEVLSPLLIELASYGKST